MRRSIFTLCSLLAALQQISAAFNVSLGLNPDTVDKLNINSYLGLWFQMSADQLVYDTIEPDAYCVTAQYGDNGDGTISVHNYQTTGAPDSGVDTIDGYAYQKDAEEAPGKLNVVFPSEGEFPAPYWVLELGPLNEDGLYDYSIVSDPFTAYLFVLARDVETFNTKYKESVSASLEKLGFTGKSAPIDTYQGSDCVYESTSRKQQIQKIATKNSLQVSPSGPETVDSLDINAYVGYWYNVLADTFVSSTTLRNLYCSTATYKLQEDGSISVHNSGTSGSPSGDFSTIDGYAFVPDASEPGKLTLHLDGVPVDGSYWVMSLGPINADGQYDYSLVSDNIGLSLYVLARDYNTFNEKYLDDVMKQLEDLGFSDRLTKPVTTYQGADCKFESTQQ